MLNRLLIIESTLEESEGKDQFICSRLLEKSSVKKIQRKRLSIEYLSYIAQGRNSITLRDARRMYNGLGMSLKDFLNRRLKHRMQQEMKADEGKGKLG
jgi:transcriptional regulator with XRE-family HTH domain